MHLSNHKEIVLALCFSVDFEALHVVTDILFNLVVYGFLMILGNVALRAFTLAIKGSF